MKKWMRLVIGIAVAVLVLGAVKDLVIKTSVEAGVQIVTGLKMSIGTFKVGLLNTLVDIRNLKILNPAGFKDREMLNMPEIYVDYDLPDIFKGKVHLTEARINMSQFTVIKNEKGALNLDSLKVVQNQKSVGKPSKSGASKAEGKAPEIQIDKLRLKIGRVVYKDYSAGGAPKLTEFNVDVDQEYANIDNPYTLVGLIVTETMAKTSIAQLTNFDIKGLNSSVSEAMANAEKMSAQTQEAQKAVAESTKQVQATVSKAANALKDTFGNPFGSDK